MFTYDVWHQQRLSVIGRLQNELSGQFNVADIRASEQGDSVMFIGRLARDAETVYDTLRERFRQLGYTLIMRRQGDADVMVAQKGLTTSTRFNPLINLLLLGATVFTTVWAGAAFTGLNPFPALRAGNWMQLGEMLSTGLAFAFTLLFILGVHEMGHYVAARWHGVQVTLPYFIPVPFGLGTLGAFIQMKSPVENRKALFDVGLAGPLAGLVVAVPLMIIGLLQSEIVPALSSERLGSSLLMQGLIALFAPHSANEAVALSPVAIAAWFGLLITGINLLPMGQLDGGHVTYAVLGKAARPIAIATFITLLGLGWYVWNGWYTWAFFALLSGLSHAAPLNDITPLDGKRTLIGGLTLILFVTLVTLKPF